ncbi:MAG TPA: hypothetical protein VGM28_09130 [Candidatus Limnocylindrales bacterium]|jgi:hypothetical protein
MHEPMNQSDVHAHVEDRIHDLYATSSELRASRNADAADDHTGLVTRTRRTIGHRLISLGGAVAGHQAGGTQAARRHAA